MFLTFKSIITHIRKKNTILEKVNKFQFNRLEFEASRGAETQE